MDDNTHTPRCRVEQQLGRAAPCPLECAFRDRAGCIFDRVDFAGRDDLARWLHDLREQLEHST
jgi:hypothetical protein